MEPDDKYITATENLCANFNCKKRSIARKEPHNKNASTFFSTFPSSTTETAVSAVRGVGDVLILKYKLQMNRMRDQRHQYHQYYDNSKMIPRKKYYYDSKKNHYKIRFSRSLNSNSKTSEVSSTASTHNIRIKDSTDTTTTSKEIKSDTNKSDIRFNKISDSFSSSTTPSSFLSTNTQTSSAMPIFTTITTNVSPTTTKTSATSFSTLTTTPSPKKHYKVEPSVIIDGKSEEFDSGRRNEDEDYLSDEPRALPLRPIIRGPNEKESDEEVTIVYAEQHEEIKLMCEVDLDIANSIWSKNGQVSFIFFR